jgi:alpha-1,6-mannosyltransferase
MASRYQWQTLFLITYAGVVFRSELAVLVLTFSAYIYYYSRYALTRTIIPAGLTGLTLGLLTTVPIDSYFWQNYPLWPEWSSFYYNTILGNSSNWGTSPWHYYFANALPRLLMNPISYTLLIPLALLAPATRQRSVAILVPSLAFVALYSLLPHKEWRFILYVIPGLTSIAALGATWIWNRRYKSAIYRGLSAILIVSVLMSFIASSGILAISRLNYPGGEAIIRLRDIAKGDRGTINVHLDNLACQTGVTRFLEARTEQVAGRARWTFDKTEDEKKLHEPVFWDQFDYVLAEHPERTIGKFEVVDTVNGFGGIRVVQPKEETAFAEITEGLKVSGNSFGRLLPVWMALENFMRDNVTRGWWITLRMEPKIRILKRQRTPPRTEVSEVQT